ncbi:hypothetical protein [Paenibacillus cremeus]|uniref:YtxH domain-containing protein n=1 Tax=Paenibacillus cremeus TaxID=2163881 RepID=A0A559KHH5_9BACL|nr:hypothetical protein [Paenibacillus cremeus]TVY11583.1 hypothetical protein FPZ49_02455 [Paenibacillus cremeus]
MRFGAFLLGGLVGAAAAVYLTGKSKPMLWSVLGKNDALGSMMMNSMNDKSDKSKSKFGDSSGSAKSNASFQGNKAKGHEEQFSAAAAGGMSKVTEFVNQDPQLKAQVNEILSSNNQSEQSQVQ